MTLTTRMQRAALGRPKLQKAGAPDAGAALQPQPRATSEKLPSLVEIKRCIPSHCFESSLSQSLMYAAKDLLLIGSMFVIMLVAEATLTSLWLRVPLHVLYWLLQGTMFWALFVVAHECGHGSFSSHRALNDALGTALNALILVPYTPWKLTHRHHHKNTGNIDKDEIFYPTREGEQTALIARTGYFGLGLAWFGYLLHGYDPRPGSHLNPAHPLFRRHVFGCVASLTAVTCMLTALFKLGQEFGAGCVIRLYAVPLFVFASWLVITTFLHHTEEDVEWYGDEEWTYVKGNLSSVDRDYGWAHALTHNIGTHQIHHLFPIIPHYHLREATDAFRKHFPELARHCDEPVYSAFLRVFRLFADQAHGLPKHCQRFKYKA